MRSSLHLCLDQQSSFHSDVPRNCANIFGFLGPKASMYCLLIYTNRHKLLSSMYIHTKTTYLRWYNVPVTQPLHVGHCLFMTNVLTHWLVWKSQVITRDVVICSSNWVIRQLIYAGSPRFTYLHYPQPNNSYYLVQIWRSRHCPFAPTCESPCCGRVTISWLCYRHCRLPAWWDLFHNNSRSRHASCARWMSESCVHWSYPKYQ